MKRIAILGSTGSIGTQTLDVVRNNRDKFEVVAISANKSIDLLLEQIIEFNPKYVAVYDEDSAIKLKEMIIPYILGCVIVFSAFSIWKTIVKIGSNIEPVAEEQNEESKNE